MICNQRKRGWNGFRYCGRPARWKVQELLYCQGCFLELRPEVRLGLEKV